MMSTTVTTPATAGTSFEDRLKHVQAIAGSLFAAFVLLHLSNVFVAPFGIAAFDNYQAFVRAFYQHPVIEILLVIGPLVAHMIAGAWLAIIREKRTSKKPLRQRMHTWAGVFLFVFIIGHITAVRGPSFFFDVYPGFAGIAFSLWYLPVYFFPYYFLLAFAGFYHATGGLRLLAAKRGYTMSAAMHRNISIAAGIWIAISLMAAGGVFFDIGNPADNDFARLYGEIMDMDPTKPVRLFSNAQE